MRQAVFLSELVRENQQIIYSSPPPLFFFLTALLIVLTITKGTQLVLCDTVQGLKALITSLYFCFSVVLQMVAPVPLDQ